LELTGGGNAARAIAPASFSADPSAPASSHTTEQQNPAKTVRPHWHIRLAPRPCAGDRVMPRRSCGPEEITADPKNG
jgi:hypothetical protein